MAFDFGKRCGPLLIQCSRIWLLRLLALNLANDRRPRARGTIAQGVVGIVLRGGPAIIHGRLRGAFPLIAAPL
jgi:hypothetical protein